MSERWGERGGGGGSREREGRTREDKELQSLQAPPPLPTAAVTRHPVYDICLLQLCVNVYMEWLKWSRDDNPSNPKH